MPQNPGLSPEVQAAITRRNGAQPQLNQMSPQAANAPQIPQPTPQSALNQASAPPGQGPQAPAQSFKPQTQDDAIVAALIEKLKNNDKAKKEAAALSTQPSPQSGGYSMPRQNPQGGGFSMSPGLEQPMPVNMMQGNYNSGLGKDYSGMNNYGRGGF